MSASRNVAYSLPPEAFPLPPVSPFIEGMIAQVRDNQQILRVLQQLNECRDDHSFNHLQAILQKEIDRVCCVPSADRGFIECYIAGEASLHLHCVIESQIFGIDMPELCAVLQADERCSALIATGKFDVETNFSLRNGHIEISMAVDVRQFSEKSHDVMCPLPTTVWLQDLNECKRRFGNTRKRITETVVGKWRNVMPALNQMRGNSEPQRKATLVEPVVGQFNAAGIHLDEVESQVIESRAKVIDNFPDKNGNGYGRVNQKVDIFVTVRVGDDFIRTCSNGETVKSIEVFRCPLDFSRSGIYAADHAGDDTIIG